MSTTAEQLLKDFDSLPESDQREVTWEILQRTRHFALPPLSDDELELNAEAMFLELDQRVGDRRIGYGRAVVKPEREQHLETPNHSAHRSPVPRR